MTETKRDPVREERIYNEAVVDAYGPEEQALGWYYYLENKIRFPFQARCTVTKATSPLRNGETVEVRRLAPEDVCSTDMVQIRWHGRTIAVPLSQLTGVNLDESPPRPLATGITGWRKATASEKPSCPPLLPRSYASLPKAHGRHANQHQ